MNSGYFGPTQGEIVACHPLSVVAGGIILVALCATGFIWFTVETDPQMLWVSKSSRAWKDKVAYEQSFGPFYRIENFILSTTQKSVPHWDSPGLPSVVRGEFLEVMFDIQDKISNLPGECFCLLSFETREFSFSFLYLTAHL